MNQWTTTGFMDCDRIHTLLAYMWLRVRLHRPKHEKMAHFTRRNLIVDCDDIWRSLTNNLRSLCLIPLRLGEVQEDLHGWWCFTRSMGGSVNSSNHNPTQVKTKRTFTVCGPPNWPCKAHEQDNQNKSPLAIDHDRSDCPWKWLWSASSNY